MDPDQIVRKLCMYGALAFLLYIIYRLKRSWDEKGQEIKDAENRMEYDLFGEAVEVPVRKPAPIAVKKKAEARFEGPLDKEQLQVLVHGAPTQNVRVADNLLLSTQDIDEMTLTGWRPLSRHGRRRRR